MSLASENIPRAIGNKVISYCIVCMCVVCVEFRKCIHLKNV